MAHIRVAVLMGGISNEREISLRSGTMVVDALDRATYTVHPLDFTGDLTPLLALTGAVDVVFLALHGPGGEDGRIQGVLDLLGIPYTGSGVLGSAMAMHKGVTKVIYAAADIPTPAWVEVRAGDDLAACAARITAEIGVPCVVKPANEGSTIGISIVRAAAELVPALSQAFTYDPDVVVERFVAGTEISVPVLGTASPRVLPEIEIVPQSGFYDYAMKYTPGATEEICPARISPIARARAAAYAVCAHQALRCRGVSRTDMIVTGDAVTALETNTLPGMTGTSLLPLSARTVGIAFPALLDLLIDDALASRKA